MLHQEVAVMTPVHKLNADLLHLLFTFLDRADLLIATRVCPEWHHAAQTKIDATLDLIATTTLQAANLKLLRRLEIDTALQDRVSGINMLEWHLDPLEPKPEDFNFSVIASPWNDGRYFSRSYEGVKDSSPAAIELLEALVKALQVARLRNFIWSGLPPLPDVLVEVLEALPTCNVRIVRNPRALETTFWSYFPQLNHRQLGNLGQICHSLKTLEVIMPSCDISILTALGRLISGTKLEALNIYVLGLRSCPTIDNAQFKLTSDMSWIVKPIIDSGRKLSLRSLELDNICVCSSEPTFQLEQITEVCKLDHLSVSCFGLVSACDDALQPKSFRLSCSPLGSNEMGSFCAREWTVKSVRRSLLDRRRLKKLVILDDEDILTEEVMQHLGPQLRVLHYHSINQLSGRIADLNLDSASTRFPSWLSCCADLRELAMDTPIPYMEDFLPYVLSCLHQLPRLDKLICCCLPEPIMEIAYEDPIPPNRQTISCATSSMLFTQLHQHRHPFTELCIIFGPLKPWDRDASMAEWGGRERLRHRTLKIELQAPLVFGSTPVPQVHCVELEEARRAQHHSYTAPFEGYWDSELTGLEHSASDEVTLLSRRPPVIRRYQVASYSHLQSRA